MGAARFAAVRVAGTARFPAAAFRSLVRSRVPSVGRGFSRLRFELSTVVALPAASRLARRRRPADSPPRSAALERARSPVRPARQLREQQPTIGGLATRCLNRRNFARWVPGCRRVGVAEGNRRAAVADSCGESASGSSGRHHLIACRVLHHALSCAKLCGSRARVFASFGCARHDWLASQMLQPHLLPARAHR